MNKLYIFMLSFSLMFSAVEIESLNPNNGEAGSDLSVELIASGINFYDFYDGYTNDFYDGYSSPSVTNINFTPSGINVNSFSISSENSITLNLNIDKITATMFDVELVGNFYNQYDQYTTYYAIKEDGFYVSSNNPLLVVNSPNSFGEVNVGDSYTLSASLYNPSTVDITLYGISMDNSDFTIPQDIDIVNAGATLDLPITFSPSTNGGTSNTMTIYSNDEYDPVMVFQMSGDGFALVGDINIDGTLNILDIVALIGYVFNDNSNPIADLNDDGTVNIVDVVFLVNLVLNYGF